MSDDVNKLKLKYDEYRPHFSRLKDNVEETIKLFLQNAKIPFLAVTSRIKDFDSFKEKIDRKKYENPFEENEDFVGIRVILYYPADIKSVEDLIDREFKVESSEDKSQTLGIDQFGYRSSHKIIRVPELWTKAPNYRGLSKYKCEIQIRTILMHAWAEIEHKMQYKSRLDVPSQLRRKLFRLSAKFEEADEQFQDIQIEMDAYRKSVEQNLQSPSSTSSESEIEINLTSIQVYAANRFPNKDGSEAKYWSGLVADFEGTKYKTISDLDKALSGTDALIDEYDKIRGISVSKVGAIRVGLDFVDREFFNKRHAASSNQEEMLARMDAVRKKLGK